MRKFINERSLVVFLFILTIITFTKAQKATRHLEQPELASGKTSPLAPPSFKMAGLQPLNTFSTQLPKK